MLKKFSVIVGFGFLFLGILGFFFENFLGIFHLNPTHNAFHLGIGIWGVLASAKSNYALIFARAIGIIYLLMGLLGFISPTMFGLMHVGATENIFHVIVGVVALFVGFRSESKQAYKVTKTT